MSKSKRMTYLIQDIRHLLNLRQRVAHPYKKGDVGIEIEVEGRNLPRGIGPWVAKQDGSLRGEAVEYVLKEPVDFKSVKASLELLEEWLENDKGTKLAMSHRTSVHVHINCQRLFTQEIYTLLALYFLFEELLVAYCGTERNGNVYCLCATDAEYLPLRVIAGLGNGDYLDSVAADDIRYSSLNLKAIHDFGSVEFRAFRGTTKASEIADWVAILEHLFKAALNFNSPKEVLDYYEGSKEYLIEKVFKGCPFFNFIFEQPKWQAAMQKGFLYTFEIVHAHRNGWVNLVSARRERTNNPDKIQEPDKKIKVGGIPIQGNGLGQWQPVMGFDQPNIIRPAPPRPQANRVPDEIIMDEEQF